MQFYIIMRRGLDIKTALEETPKIYQSLSAAKAAAKSRDYNFWYYLKPETPIKYHDIYEITLDSDSLTLVEEWQQSQENDGSV